MFDIKGKQANHDSFTFSTFPHLEKGPCPLALSNVTERHAHKLSKFESGRGSGLVTEVLMNR